MGQAKPPAFSSPAQGKAFALPTRRKVFFTSTKHGPWLSAPTGEDAAAEERLRARSAPDPRGPNTSGETKTLVRSLYHDRGEKPEDIAEKLGRRQSWICRVLFRAKAKPVKMGRPRVLSETQVERARGAMWRRSS